MTTTSEITEKYLNEHSSIKDCLKKGIINYSKLARLIARELKIEKKSSMEAVLIACRRFELKIKKEKELEERILKILKKSELEVKNKIVVGIIDKKIYADNISDIAKKIRSKTGTFYAIEGTNVFTIIISEEFADELKNLFKRNLIKLTKDLVMIKIKSPEEIENTPGVSAYIHSLFASYSINIIESMSCWTDSIFVIEEKNTAKTMEFLRF